MSRAPLIYDDRSRPQRRFEGLDVSTPLAGWYRARLRSGGVWGGVRLFYGPPRDPVTGEELDRSWRWQALFNGEPVDFHEVWPVCADSPISRGEYDRLRRQQKWAQQHAPESAHADPRRRRDPLSIHEALPF